MNEQTSERQRQEKGKMTMTTTTTEMTTDKKIVYADVKHISIDSKEEVTLLCSSFLNEINSQFDFSVKLSSCSMSWLKHSLAKRFLIDNPVARKHIEDTLTVLKYEDVPEYFVKLITDTFFFSILEIEKYNLFEKWCRQGRYNRNTNTSEYVSVEKMSTDRAYFVHTNNLIGKYAEYEYNLSCGISFQSLVLYFYNMILEMERKYIKERQERFTKLWNNHIFVKDLSWGHIAFNENNLASSASSASSAWVLNYNMQDFLEDTVWKDCCGRIYLTKEINHNGNTRKAEIQWNDDEKRPRFEVRTPYGENGYGFYKKNVSLKTAIKLVEDQYKAFLEHEKSTNAKKDRITLAKEQMMALVPTGMTLKFSEHSENEAYIFTNNVFILKFEYSTVDVCDVRIGERRKQLTFAQVIEFYNLNSKFFL